LHGQTKLEDILHGQPKLEVGGIGWISPGTQAHLLKESFVSATTARAACLGTTALDLWEPRRVSVCVAGKC